ncbi:hypothetical protein [Mucilaginibacter lacusdianchii]|uniref:hypothetical protein n=1 Tax=Mucilaginibacter lacusdianchii TaxID=2684211 RepID=UPI00131A8D6E|nr:hypothetical protein [Mucilaginibacter sp. JXJ CY 39]
MHIKAITILGLAALASTTACNQSSTKQEQHKADSTTAPAAAPVAQSAPTSSETGHLLGVWYDEAIKSPDGQNVAYEIVSNKDKQIFIQVITFTGTSITVNDIPPISATATALKKTGDMYMSKANANEYYKVDKKTGDLLIYDQSGLVATCKKIL